MIRRDVNGDAAAAWRAALQARMTAALGVAETAGAAEIVAGAAEFVAERAGRAPVRDEELDRLLGEALCAAGRGDLALRLMRVPSDARWAAALAPSASPALRGAALRRWLAPYRGTARAGEIWMLDTRRLFRDTPEGVELLRFRLLAAALDALAAAIPPERGLDALALRAPAPENRRAAARLAREIRDFCALRLAEAARRCAWPRAPRILRADLIT